MTVSDADLRRAVFIDTSAIFNVLNAADASHAAAAAVYRSLVEERRLVVTSNFVVAETHALFVRRVGREAGVRLLGQLRQGFAVVIRVEPVDEERAVEIIEGFVDKAFSYADATSFALIDRLGIRTAFSFDRHFAQYSLTTLGLDL